MSHFVDVRTARKDHVPYTRTGGCENCRGTIKKGERYKRLAATPHDEVMDSDHWSHMKVHEVCP